MQPALSSCTSDVNILFMCVMEVSRFSLGKVYLVISVSICRSGNKVLIIVDNAMYSDSQVERATTVCSWLDHVTGQLQYVMI